MENGVLTARGFGPLAGPAARWAARRKLSPAGAARIGFVVTAVAAVWFSEGTLSGSLTGSVFLAVVLFSDAIRDRLWSEPRDALALWTSTVLSYLRECVLYVGLAAGASMSGATGVWAWATGALIAQALRESVLSARRAQASTPARGAESVRPGALHGSASAGRLSPIDVVDPSRSGRAPADPSFTAELLGGAPQDDASESDGQEEPIRIRTTPPRRGGGLEPLKRFSTEEGTTRQKRGGKTRRALVPGRGPYRERDASHPRREHGLTHALAAFSQSERFLVIAVTVTIWDASVSFIALSIGSAVAMIGASMRSSRHD